MSSTTVSLPVLSLSDLDDPTTRSEFLTQLRDTTHETGFFYLTGHGIDHRLSRELLSVSRAFFALPVEEKLSIENVNSPHFRGYTRLGGERTQGRQDWREQLDIGPERDAISAEDSTAPWDILEGPNQWPEALPGLRRILDDWNAGLTDVGLRLLHAWAESLGQDPTVFDDAFADRPSTLIKIVRYPGTNDNDQGVGSHRDSGVLTLLWLEPGTAGLQVEHDGQWIDVPPVEGTLVVNIGELLEVATDGYLKATVHRVISPPTDRDRISIPFFYNPALSAQVPRLQLPAELAAESRGVSADASNPIHDTYGANALKSRLRAHPDVARIHHPGLVAQQL